MNVCVYVCVHAHTYRYMRIDRYMVYADRGSTYFTPNIDISQRELSVYNESSTLNYVFCMHGYNVSRCRRIHAQPHVQALYQIHIMSCMYMHAYVRAGG